MIRRVPDLTKIRDLIGYCPSLGLTEILRDTIAYHRPKPALASDHPVDEPSALAQVAAD